MAAALTGVAGAWVVLRLGGHASLFDLLLGGVLSGVLVGRLVAMVAAGVNPLVSPLDILVVRGGVDPVGATVGALAYLLWSARSEPGRLDLLAAPAVAGMAAWHAGCLWRGSCLGVAGDVPWGWALAGSEVIRHPVEMYAAALLAVAAWLLYRYRPVGSAGLALAATAGARLVTEPLRPGLGAGPEGWYALAVAAGLLWWMWMARSARHTRPRAPDSP